ncbi:MAG: hypothetical protein ACP5HG_10360 [Anaerolineae bacterium]
MFRWFIPTVVAVLAGLLVLLGYLVPIDALASLRVMLVDWASVLAAFALLLAYGNLLRVHLGRLFQKRAKHRIASLILLVSAVAGLVLVLVQGSEGALVQTWLEAILVPGQSALLAVTVVTLVLAGMRLLRTRRRVESVLFLVVALVTLLTTVPIVYPEALHLAMQFVSATVTGGMRGLLLGVVLGIVITGLRVIFGLDRPQSGG